MTGLFFSNRKNIVRKLIWKPIDLFSNQVINFLNIFTEHGKIIAIYTKKIERSSKLLCSAAVIAMTNQQKHLSSLLSSAH